METIVIKTATGDIVWQKNAQQKISIFKVTY